MCIFPIPIAFPNKIFPVDISILAADIGATKTDMALYQSTIPKKSSTPQLVLQKETEYISREWTNLTAMIWHFLDKSTLPTCMSIAIAGPVQNGKCKVTNLDWEVDIEDLKQEFHKGNISLINDLEANAYGLAGLQATDLQSIYEGKGNGKGNAAIISPGTGLGEAGLFWDGNHLHPFATEGGHTDFGPRNELDIQLVQYFHQQYKHISWERVVSGKGIYSIYKFLRDVQQIGTPGLLEVQIQQGDPAAAISRAANDNIRIAKKTMNMFVRFLAEEAANLALKLKATGGIFIGGGILPKIWNPHYQTIFLNNFFEVGRLRPLLESVPVHLILNPKTALLGAAHFGAYQQKKNN